jgi:hypothetical protein
MEYFNVVQTVEISTGNILHEDELVTWQGICENSAFLGYFAERISYLVRGGSPKSSKKYVFVCFLQVQYLLKHRTNNSKSSTRMVNKRPTKAFKYPYIDIPSLSYMFRCAKSAILRESSWSCRNCCSMSWERNGIRVVYGDRLCSGIFVFAFCVRPAVTHRMYCSVLRLIVLTPLSFPPFISRGAPRQRKVELWARNVWSNLAIQLRLQR